MADWTEPTVNSLHTAVISALKDRDVDLSKMATPSAGLEADMIRWNSTSSKFEIYSGSTWGDLASSFDMSVTNLNGQLASYYRNATNMNTGILPAGRINDTSHGNRGGGALHADATTSSDGFMTHTDKTKLNGIATGANVNLNAADTLNLIKTVDGGGSGLNADLLDGINGADYTRRTIAQSITGVQTHTARPIFNGGLSGSTSPFTVDSNTKVANLNADLLDGLSSGSYIQTSGGQIIAGDITAKNASDAEITTISAIGVSQGTGILFVGQSSTHGGGIGYEGDGTPGYGDFTSDQVTLFRRTAGNNFKIGWCSHDNSAWTFASTVSSSVTPTSADHLTRKGYVDAELSSLDASDITSGTLLVTRGGTGVTTSTGTGNTVRSISPTLTGNPIATTPIATDNDTSIATTAFVRTAITDYASTDLVPSSSTAVGSVMFCSYTSASDRVHGYTTAASNLSPASLIDSTSALFYTSVALTVGTYRLIGYHEGNVSGYQGFSTWQRIA